MSLRLSRHPLKLRGDPVRETSSFVTFNSATYVISIASGSSRKGKFSNFGLGILCGLAGSGAYLLLKIELEAIVVC